MNKNYNLKLKQCFTYYIMHAVRIAAKQCYAKKLATRLIMISRAF